MDLGFSEANTFFLLWACTDKSEPQRWWSVVVTNTRVHVHPFPQPPTLSLSAVIFPFSLVPLKKQREPKRYTQADLFLWMRFCCFALYLLETNYTKPSHFLKEIKKMKEMVSYFVTIQYLKIVKAGSTYVYLLFYIKTSRIILRMISWYF